MISEGVVATLDPRAIAILGKVLGSELRDISGRLQDFVGNPAHTRLSKRLQSTLNVCDLTGLYGVRTFLQSLVKFTEKIEAEAHEMPRVIIMEQARLLHGAIAVLGTYVTRLQKGTTPQYHSFREPLQRICEILGDEQIGKLYAPAFPSVELDSVWRDRQPADADTFASYCQDLSSAAAAHDFRAVTQAAERCADDSPYRELVPLFELVAIVSAVLFEIDSTAAIAADRETGFSAAIAGLASDSAIFEGGRMPAPVMSATIHMMSVLNLRPQDGLPPVLADRLSAAAVQYGATEASDQNTDLRQTFRSATEKLVEIWARAASGGNLGMVAQHVKKFRDRSASLDSAAYRTLVSALDDTVSGASGNLDAPYELWINGSIAIIMMGLCVGDTRIDNDSDEMAVVDAIVGRLKSGASVSEFMPASQTLRKATSKRAMTSVFAEVQSILVDVERAIEDVRRSHLLRGAVVDPEEVASSTGRSVSEKLATLARLFQALCLPNAATAAESASVMAVGAATWGAGDSSDHFFGSVSVLTLFASRIRPNDPTDLQISGEALPSNVIEPEAADGVASMSVGNAQDTGDVAFESEGGAAMTKDDDQSKASEQAPLDADENFSLDVANDPALLKVFLEEAASICSAAREAIEAIFAGVVVFNGDSFVLIRRAFHTLKGSSVTAGLGNFSKLAEACQDAMDAWSSVDVSEHPSAEELVAFALVGLDFLYQQLNAVDQDGQLKISVREADRLLEYVRTIQEMGYAFSADGGGVDQSMDLLDTARAAAIDTGGQSTENAGETLDFDAGFFDESAGNDPKFGDLEDKPSAVPIEDLRKLMDSSLEKEQDLLDFASGILGTMLPEVTDGLQRIESIMENIAFEVDYSASLLTLRHVVHGLKGALRTAGAKKAGAIGHVLEEDLEILTAAEFDAERFAFYRYAFDLLIESVEQIRRSYADYCADTEPPKHRGRRSTEIAIATKPAPTKIETTTDLPRGPAESSGEGPGIVRSNISPIPASDVTLVEPRRIHPVHPRGVEHASRSANRQELVIERLGQHTGEVAVLHSRTQEELEITWREMKGLSDNIDRLLDQVKVLSLQAESRVEFSGGAGTAGGFDPLEMDHYSTLQETVRSVVEKVTDIRTSENLLAASLSRLEETEDHKGSLSVELQRAARQLMVVAFSSRLPLMKSTVRLAASEAGVGAELVLEGDAEVSSAIINKLGTAIDHLLRNAIAHGIEPPEVRKARNKPETGKISVYVFSDSEKTTISITDDGAGIDPDAVLRKAVEQNLAVSPNYSKEEIFELLFSNGFSTADSLSELAGRGVGLGAVKGALQEIGGEIFVASTLGQGTEFRIEAPSDISSLSVIPIRSENFTCMIPSSLIERIVSVSAAEALQAAEDGYVVVYGAKYRYMRMGWLLTEESSVSRKSQVQLLLCGGKAGAPTAFEVDETAVGRKVLVRALGSHISGIPGFIAGTSLANGQVSLIVNPLRMRVIGRDRDTAQSKPAMPLVMVVDDSSTIRLYTGKFLRSQGYEVIEASHGIEALEVLKDTTPDFFLLDVEMPHMNGFALVANLRSDPRFRDTPIAMITSRTAQKHRDHAEQLGANAYIGKPFDESELLSFLNEYRPILTA